MATLPPLTTEPLPKRVRTSPKPWFEALLDDLARRMYGHKPHRHCAGVDETGRRCECLGRDA